MVLIYVLFIHYVFCILARTFCLVKTDAKYHMQPISIPVSVQAPRTVPLTYTVADAIQAIRSGALLPLGDYGTDVLYYFVPLYNGLGSIRYTVFDRSTHVGLASFLVRYGVATTIRDVLFSQMGKTSIPLEFSILPKIDYTFFPPPGDVIPG